MSEQPTLDRLVMEKQLGIEASKIATAPLLRKGWMLVLAGWGIGLIPLLGIAGWIMAFACGIIIGIVVMTRGNTSGGLILVLSAWLGTIPIALICILFWMLFGFSGLGFLGALF